MTEIDVFRAASLKAIPHGFLGRRGGISTGDVASLNVGLGCNDERSAVDENRRRAVAAIAPNARLVTLHQVHSAEAVYATGPWPTDARPHADAVVTDQPGLLLGILTADCAPVLLADAEAGVIGAAHAGWRGAVAGMADAVVAAMIKLGARSERIAAAVGPCIARESYEVDEQFRVRFVTGDAENARFFAQAKSGKPHFDLTAYVADRLRKTGVGSVEMLNLDTYGDPDRFFSFRRATHRGEPDYGRQVSAIALP